MTSPFTTFPTFRSETALRGRLLILLCLPTALLACTRSAPSASGPDLLPNQIAATLTAAPTLPPSRTPPPSATPQPTFTSVPSSSPTASDTPTAGPSATPTGPPLEADDPRFGLNLSAPDLSDDFATQYGWFEYSDRSAATILWQRGQMHATDHRADGFLWWSTSGETAGNVYAEISATVEECAGKDSYGLALRIGGSGYDRGYTLELSCDGHFRLRKFRSGGEPEVMEEWTESEAIKTGTGADNRLGFLADGSSLVAFANGKRLAELNDSDYVFGNFGLFAEANESEPVSATFRDFALWYLQP